MTPEYKHLVLELGGVLFKGDRNNVTSISPN